MRTDKLFVICSQNKNNDCYYEEMMPTVMRGNVEVPTPESIRSQAVVARHALGLPELLPVPRSVDVQPAAAPDAGGQLALQNVAGGGRRIRAIADGEVQSSTEDEGGESDEGEEEEDAEEELEPTSPSELADSELAPGPEPGLAPYTPMRRAETRSLAGDSTGRASRGSAFAEASTGGGRSLIYRLYIYTPCSSKSKFNYLSNHIALSARCRHASVQSVT
jgi:hypothetical protein